MSEELTTIQQIALGAPEECRECPLVKEIAYLWELRVETGKIALESMQQRIAQQFGNCGRGPRKRPGLHDGTPRDYCQNPGTRRY